MQKIPVIPEPEIVPMGARKMRRGSEEGVSRANSWKRIDVTQFVADAKQKSPSRTRLLEHFC